MRDSSDMCKKIGCNIKALMMQLSTELFPFRTCARLVTTTVAKDSVQSVARVAAASTRTTATSASSRSRHPGSGSSSSSSSEHQYQQRWCDWNEPAVRKRTTSASVPESSEAQARMARAGGLGCSSTGACAVPQPGKAPQFRSPNCTCTYIYICTYVYTYIHTLLLAIVTLIIIVKLTMMVRIKLMTTVGPVFVPIIPDSGSGI